MRAVLQRVSAASVTVDGAIVGEIQRGLLALVGIGHRDGEAEVAALVDKVLGLRIFPDDDGKMNRSVVDAGGGVLVVSQFTLLGDVRRGRRPSFTAAASPEIAAPLIDHMLVLIGQAGVPVAGGRFGAHMDVKLVNDGPVTIVVDVGGGRVQ
ncbi:MAG TPA: D-aminoacyl-tRNA deacylase [Acidimicrobiia bacterium]|jgi:D-tyrosyl-tRNA(Tyr) deacylase|nr:D-aminoacyl-tRNA deacylase [Acidimicrobiia bacterium]